MNTTFTLPDNETLVNLYSDDVFKVCSYYLGSRSSEEDAFQEVWLKVMNKRSSFDGRCPPKYWLLSIARNTCKDILKSSWSTKMASIDEMTENSGDKGDYLESNFQIPYDEARKEENMHFDSLPDSELWNAINSLPSKFKDVVLLKYYYDMDNYTIANQLGISETTVRSRLFRTRKKLSKYMGDEDKQKENNYAESI